MDLRLNLPEQERLLGDLSLWDPLAVATTDLFLRTTSRYGPTVLTPRGPVFSRKLLISARYRRPLAASCTTHR